MAFPDVEEKAKVTPMEGDCSDKIQAAIDSVSTMPLVNDFRGAVVLAPGIFKCSKTLTLHTSGVVLRGSGSGRDGTIIQMTDAPHPCVVIGSKNNTQEVKGKKRTKKKKEAGEKKDGSSVANEIADEYVPSGATSLRLQERDAFQVGDLVRISRPASAEWIHFMGMDNLVYHGEAGHWLKEGKAIIQDREIKSVNGSEITWEMPLTDCIDASKLGGRRGTVQKISPDQNLSECGVEKLRIEAAPPKGDWMDAQNIGVTLEGCEDAWVRNVSTLNQLPDVLVSESAERISLDSVLATHPTTVTKSSRSAGKATDFRLGGRQTLMNKCGSSGDGSFYVSTAQTESMLNVVLNCVFSGNGSIQPHMKWSTGLLLDGCQVKDGEIILRNRRELGGGHGWTMGWGVVWNCSAKGITVEQPPGSINWCIGSTGNYDAVSKSAQEWLYSKGVPVKPDSLYLAQLRARLGDQAVKAIGY
ncbi:MAG: hypothetical protein EBT75_06220 [Proteobacteria bacterium]|nr:hypothetical protein [Pseudomonadota bacterium]NBS07132.1 hypothetical protein [Verrucomicrobiota bacterium]NBS50216.1 hypothetical protein [Verrucomicrobiota bacterium]NBS79064.1 hypothetical protein [bacterium]